MKTILTTRREDDRLVLEEATLSDSTIEMDESDGPLFRSIVVFDSRRTVVEHSEHISSAANLSSQERAFEQAGLLLRRAEFATFGGVLSQGSPLSTDEGMAAEAEAFARSVDPRATVASFRDDLKVIGQTSIDGKPHLVAAGTQVVQVVMRGETFTFSIQGYQLTHLESGLTSVEEFEFEVLAGPQRIATGTSRMECTIDRSLIAE